MSNESELRALIEDLVFFIQNQDHYIGHLTKEGVEKSSQSYIVSRVRETVKWEMDFSSRLKEWDN
jgi:hypothetical protein